MSTVNGPLIRRKLRTVTHMATLLEGTLALPRGRQPICMTNSKIIATYVAHEHVGISRTAFG